MVIRPPDRTEERWSWSAASVLRSRHTVLEQMFRSDRICYGLRLKRGLPARQLPGSITPGCGLGSLFRPAARVIRRI
jgi:hypothetical protein